jgi:hypothetical protein
LIICGLAVGQLVALQPLDGLTPPSPLPPPLELLDPELDPELPEFEPEPDEVEPELEPELLEPELVEVAPELLEPELVPCPPLDPELWPELDPEPPPVVPPALEGVPPPSAAHGALDIEPHELQAATIIVARKHRLE